MYAFARILISVRSVDCYHDYVPKAITMYEPVFLLLSNTSQPTTYTFATIPQSICSSCGSRRKVCYVLLKAHGGFHEFS